MAGNWGSDTSGTGSDSDTETGEESLMENPMTIALQTIAQYQTSSMRNDHLNHQPPQDEVIIVSSDEEDAAFFHSSEESFDEESMSYATTSPSTATESSGSSMRRDDFPNPDPSIYLRQYLHTTNLVFTPVGNEYSTVAEAALQESSRDYTSSPETSNVLESIEQRLPIVGDLAPIQVTLNSARTITLDFPSPRDICSKSSGNDTQANSVSRGEDRSSAKKSSKYDPDSPSMQAFKKYHVSTVSEAIWRPEERKAEVIQRRGKQLETVGSAGNPMFLEFYEALYLMTRVKLRLLFPDQTPMAVFDAYSVLMRDDDDSELYSIYEYLMDSGATVAPFRVPKRKATNQVNGPSSFSTGAISPNIPAAVIQPPKTKAFSAYKKDDSDSDLEVLSCNMPAAPKPKEVALTYAQSVPYDGPDLAFPALTISMDYVDLRIIPQELLPECQTAVSSCAQSGASNARIPVTGSRVKLHPYWFTAEGMEDTDRVKENIVTPVRLARTRKRKQVVRISPQKKKRKTGPQNQDQATLPGNLTQSGALQERYSRRWFPRWFDGVELGVHSLSIVDTLHRYTGDGIPKIDWTQSWSQYKNVFAKLVKESHDQGENNCLYQGTTTPLMTGTKKNQTQLIFAELHLTREISEISEYRKRLEINHEISTPSHNGLALPVEGLQNASRPHSSSPRIIFDVFTDSTYSKTKSCTPDYRVVKLKASSVLKINDLMKLSLEAGDATLLIAHVGDGKVRVRQAMNFSIPRYN